MNTDLFSYLTKFYQEEDGQALTEYGAVIAFVALLVALVFSTANGDLSHAVQTAYSSMANQLNVLSSSSS